MSQVATKKRLNIHNERVKVIAHFHEQGSVLKGTATGRCEDFEVELSVESEEPVEVIHELIRLAHAMCFTEDALTGQVKLIKRHILNGVEV